MSHFFNLFKSYILSFQENLALSLSNNAIKNIHKTGIAYVIEDDNFIEKGAVCVSFLTDLNVENENLAKSLTTIDNNEKKINICGISCIIHSKNPLTPTIHFNYRYIEYNNEYWFGGGVDLTPFYIDKEFISDFHTKLKKICDAYDERMYYDFKKQADDYFYLPHRKEHRGVGGLFFDKLTHGQYNFKNKQSVFDFIKSCNTFFINMYIPHLKRNIKFNETEKQWQLIRRSRYAEFNLLYDRGTKFGFETPNANIENILLSMPPTVNWKYKDTIHTEPHEKELIDIIKTPIDWINL